MNQLWRYWDKIIAASQSNEPGNWMSEPDKNGNWIKKDECWDWQGAVTGKSDKNRHAGGYGNFRLGGKNRYAHNLSYLLLEVLKDKDLSQYSDEQILKMLDEMKKGKLEGSHTCQNRLCVNPKHQVRESHSENVRRPHGRHRKLDAAAVALIKRLILDGDGSVEIGKKYEVTRRCIDRIKAGATWTDIKPAKKGFADAA